MTTTHITEVERPKCSWPGCDQVYGHDRPDGPFQPGVPHSRDIAVEEEHHELRIITADDSDTRPAFLAYCGCGWTLDTLYPSIITEHYREHLT